MTASLSSLGVVGGASSDLSEGELERSPGLFRLQLEGVFIGVVLHDIVVHVHQDPFFTLLEDFPNLFLGNIIFVRDLKEQKKNNITKFCVHDWTKQIPSYSGTDTWLSVSHTCTHKDTDEGLSILGRRGYPPLERAGIRGLLLPKVTDVTTLLYGHGILKLIPYRAVLCLQRKYRPTLSTQNPCAALVLPDERTLLQQEN